MVVKLVRSDHVPCFMYGLTLRNVSAISFCGLLKYVWGEILMVVRLFVAVAQAGISILSGSHNATTTTSVSPDKAQVQSGAFDEDELFARAAQSREEMRRLKMPRKYSELQDENGGYGDLIDDFNPVADEDDGDSHNDDAAADDAGVDDDDDDDYDDSGGFEGAHEVGFTAPPKGFKAEVQYLPPFLQVTMGNCKLEPSLFDIVPYFVSCKLPT